jgi:hypothetical protein
VLHQTKAWLGAIPWSALVQKNQELCSAKGFPHTLNPKTCSKAQRLWESAYARPCTLGEAIELCRRCNDVVPFTFASDQTFIAVGLELVEDMLHRLPPVEAQILRQTVSHYIAGFVTRKEMVQVFQHCEQLLVKQRAFSPVTAPVTVVQVQRS